MALFQVDFNSVTLSRSVQFNIVIPSDVSLNMKETNPNYNREMKTLYLLHGFSGNSNDWLLWGTAKEVSAKYNIAIVMPTGENSFYVDSPRTGGKYGEFIGEELVSFIRTTFNLSMNKEDTYIGGLSMGGFGALRNGLKYPDVFSKVVALSSALIIHDVKNIENDHEDQIANFAFYQSVFGDLKKIESGDHNPEKLLRDLKHSGNTIPKIYMACGKDDFLIENNRAFKKILDGFKVEVTYIEDEGIHDWLYWNAHIEPAIEWLVQ